MAWRNIWRNPTRSWVVIGAIALGIWAAIAMTGFATGMMKSYISNAITHVVAHIQIHDPAFLEDKEVKYVLKDLPEVANVVAAQPGIKAVSTRTVVSAMLASSQGVRGIQTKGVVPEQEALVSLLDTKIVEGEFLSEAGKNPMLISRDLAEKLKLKLRSKVVLTFQDEHAEIVSAAFRVVGIYDTGNNPFDLANVFIRANDLNQLLLGAAADSLGYPIAHEMAILLDETNQVNSIATDLQKKLPHTKVQTYREVSPDLELYESQMKTISMVYLTIIMLALIFGIINTMLMAVLERFRELGMLMAIGMNKLRVFLMIVLEALLLGIVGAPLGIMLGAATIAYLKKYGLDMSMYAESLSNYGMSSIIYFDVDPAVYQQVAVAVVFTAVLASLYPAFKAIRLKPVEALGK
ncbi:MAG TPA: ABC transporter permease [Saprospiraceae bacterium]|nr:ABC transporter permease [Saprospiraceae bacterium]HMQ85174.1 ABC transporter permease [Saprospiraceae bacterium]